MKGASLLAISIGAACVGCAGGADTTTMSNAAVTDSIRLKADTISSAPVLGRLQAITLVGSTLWVADRSGNPALHAIDTATRSVLRSVGRPGSGPGDIPRVSSISVDLTDSSAIWVAGVGKMTRITGSSYLPNSSGPPTSFSYKNTGALWAYSLAGGRFVGNAYTDSATLVIFDSTGNVLSTADIPAPGNPDVSARERIRALQGSVLCVGKRGSMLALVYRHEARVDFYSAQLSRTASAAVPFPYAARFDTNSRPRPRPAFARPDSGYRGKVFEEGRHNYGNCAFSDHYLFALYSGKTAADEPTGEIECCGTLVHVFDFNGRLVRILDLGVSLSALAVTPSGDRIFGTSGWAESIVYGFAVPTLNTP